MQLNCKLLFFKVSSSLFFKHYNFICSKSEQNWHFFLLLKILLIKTVFIIIRPILLKIFAGLDLFIGNKNIVEILSGLIFVQRRKNCKKFCFIFNFKKSLIFTKFYMITMTQEMLKTLLSVFKLFTSFNIP